MQSSQDGRRIADITLPYVPKDILNTSIKHSYPNMDVSECSVNAF
jgi:hypothetical protein